MSTVATVHDAPAIPPSMLERMTLIIDAFEGPSALLPLEEISRRTNLPRSTVHRIVNQLVELQWVEQTHRGYRLGRRVLGQGVRAADHHQELRAAAAPHLHELWMRSGGVVHLAVLDDDRVSYLDKLGGAFALSVPSRVGGSNLAHLTALGRSMLAYLDPLEVDLLVPRTYGAAEPGRSEPGQSERDLLHADLYRIRARGGLALERGRSFRSLACAAAPVRDASGPVAAISVVVPADQILERVAPMVVQAALATSRALCGEPPLTSRRPRALHAV